MITVRGHPDAWACLLGQSRAIVDHFDKQLSQIDYDEFLADFDAYIEVLKSCFYQ